MPSPGFPTPEVPLPRSGCYMVAYDITDDRRRRKLVRLLQGYGHRLQKSLFICDLELPLLRDLEAELARFSLGENDLLKLLPVRERGQLPAFWLAG